jgi:hypothetical protein
MAQTRTRTRPAPRVATLVAADFLGAWGIPVGAVLVAAVAATLTAFELIAPAPGLAVTVLGALVLLAHVGLRPALDAERTAPTVGAGAVLAIAVAWVLVCYAPFHALFFPGAPLHQAIRLVSADAALPVVIPTGGHRSLDLLLEGELPPSAGGETALPVAYTLTFEDADHRVQTLSGQFDESLRTQRLGRRGTATVLQAHHTERRLLENPGAGDLRLSGVALEPATGSAVTLEAYAHPLPPLPILVVLAAALLAGAVAVDARVVGDSEGTFTLATAGILGTATIFWTSNTVHFSVSSVIGSAIFGGLLGAVAGATLWWVARRTVARPRR